MQQFGLLGGALRGLAGLVSLLVGAVDLLFARRPVGAIDAGAEAAVLFVVGGLAIFFSWLAGHEWSSRPIASGVLPVVLAVVGWVATGVGAGLLAPVGSLFVFLAGVLYLVGPAGKVVRVAVSTP